MSFFPQATGIVPSVQNSTTAPLAANAEFAGVFEDVSAYQEISVSITGAPTSASGTFFFEFSKNGVAVDLGVPVASALVDSSTTQPQILRVVLPFFRVRYVNGPVAQVTAALTTVYHYAAATRTTRYLDSVIDKAIEPVTIVRAVLTGETPGNTFANVPLTREHNLRVSVADVGPLAEDRILGADKGVFGAAVTSERITQIAARFNLSLFGQNFSETVTGTGAITQAGGFLALSSGTAPTASATVESLATIAYQPGREIYLTFTAAFTAPTSAASHQRYGFRLGANSIFLGYRGLVFGTTVRSSSADVFTPLAASDVDTLSGAPDSRFTRDGVPEALDPSLMNVYRLRFGWLGSSPILFEAMAPDGQWVLFQIVRQPNTSTGLSIETPDLAPFIEVEKVGADATPLSVRTGSLDAGIVGDSKVGTLLAGNSTTQPLLASGVFVGVPQSTLNAAQVLLFVFSDADSATGGLSCQWSSDAANWDDVSQKFSVQASFNRTIPLAVRAQYFRVVYTNGAAPQSVFRLAVIMQSGAAGPTRGLGLFLNEDNVGALARSVLAARDPLSPPDNSGTNQIRNLTMNNASASIRALHTDVIDRAARLLGTIALPANASQESGGNLAAILAKLSADPATQATLAAVLAKLDVALSTRASETTLAAILAGLSAALDVSLSSRASEATLTTRASDAGISAIFGRLGDGTQTTQVTNFPATQPVSAAALPLPTGASTGALQTTGNTSLASIDAKTPALVAGRQPVDGSGVTQPVSAAALPLPTGASTGALQTAGNTSLASIDGKTPVLVAGRQPVDGSGVTQPVSFAGSGYRHIAANGTLLCKSGAGVLRRIVINKKGTGANTLTVYDSLTGSGTIVAVIDTTINPGVWEFGLAFTTGLTVVLATATAADLTVVLD